ncbi:MAG TPA: RuBisCO large subunit C-terminal-like domain-containing protein [Candidatus Nanoarchaeia archaeon]|nr:RuBisCO large subunit C-terminal-like domain-containing protein [Candidatus Nanoarchaeia archaeon]
MKLSRKPSKNDVVVDYKIRPNKISLEEASRLITGEFPADFVPRPRTPEKLKPVISSIDKKNHGVRIAYPNELFENENVSQILSLIAGRVFGLRALKSIRIEDVSFPLKLLKSFRGPKFGIDGIRKISKIKDRPLLATVLKPRFGLSSEIYTRETYASWLGGCDIVKDDESLATTKTNNFDERLKKILIAKDKAEKETMQKKLYIPNISAETVEMTRRAEKVKALGGEFVMVDISSVGWSAFHTIRKMDPDIIMHGQMSNISLFTRNPEHGVSARVLAKIARLVGADMVHINSAFGSVQESPAEIRDAERELEYVAVKGKGHILEQKWFGIKKSMPYVSGGIQPVHIPKLVKLLGKNIVISLSSGIHRHPDGTIAGAIASRQAIEAVMKGIDLHKYAKTMPELKRVV